MGDTGFEYVIFDHPLDQPMGNGDVNGSLKMLHPRTKAELKPTLLDGTVIEASGRENPRKALAEWMVKHPYFAEAAVNRLWSYFFGRGLVDPVDDFRSTNPPTHPELLARLAEEFRSHDHDLRHMIRTIVNSRTYQLSGRPNAGNKDDRTNYSHALPRALDAEVLLDAICDVTEVPEVFTTGVSDASKMNAQAPLGTRAIQLRQPDLFFSRFLELYGRPNRLTLPERSGKANLGQALHMLAGSAYQEKVTAPQGRLRRLIQSGKSNSEIIREFYLAAFTRMPERTSWKSWNERLRELTIESGALGDLRVGRACLARICGESLREAGLMSCTGCLNLTRRESMRRDFLRVGSLGFLGISLPQFLRAADAQKRSNGKAQSCILLWLEGGPSQMDTWDPKPNSRVQADLDERRGHSDLGAAAADSPSAWTSSLVVRSMHTKGNDHPQGTHYAITGHEPNPAMHFPSLGAIISKEAGPRNGDSAQTSWFRNGSAAGNTKNTSAPVSSAPITIRWRCRIQADKDFRGRGSDAAEGCVGAGRPQPPGIVEDRRPPLSRAVRRRRARQHGWFHRAGDKDAAESVGA